MNSEEASPPPAGAGPGSRNENPASRKSRWQRGPSRPGESRPASPAAAKGACGIVTDLASARESLSGRLAGGSEPGAGSGEQGAGKAGRVEEFRDEVVRETRDERRDAPRQQMEEFRDEAAPESRREARRHDVEEFRDESVRQEDSARVEQRREPASEPPVEEFRDETAARTREDRRERPAKPEPREDSRNRGSGTGGEHRQAMISLMPDPANDAAPRRLRTESARPAPAQDYAPSRAGQVPDKTILSERRERSPERDGARPKAHATIDVRVKPGRGDKAEKGKKGSGFFGFIKRALGFGEIPQVPAPGFEPEPPAAKDEAHGERKHHEAHPASGRDGEGSGDGRRRRRRRRGGRGRHSGGREPGPEGHRHHGDI